MNSLLLFPILHLLLFSRSVPVPEMLRITHIFPIITFPVSTTTEIRNPSRHLAIKSWVILIFLKPEGENGWSEMADIFEESCRVSEFEPDEPEGFSFGSRVAEVEVSPVVEVFIEVDILGNVLFAGILLIRAGVGAEMVEAASFKQEQGPVSWIIEVGDLVLPYN